MPRVQFGLGIVLANLLKWHKARHGRLENLKATRARQAAASLPLGHSAELPEDVTPPSIAPLW